VTLMFVRPHQLCIINEAPDAKRFKLNFSLHRLSNFKKNFLKILSKKKLGILCQTRPESRLEFYCNM
jgi:hypothetical protein